MLQHSYCRTCVSSPQLVATTTNLTSTTSVTRATSCTVITHYQRSVQLPSTTGLYKPFSSNTSSKRLTRDELSPKGTKRFNTLREVAEDALTYFAANRHPHSVPGIALWNYPVNRICAIDYAPAGPPHKAPKSITAHRLSWSGTAVWSHINFECCTFILVSFHDIYWNLVFSISLLSSCCSGLHHPKDFGGASIDNKFWNPPSPATTHQHEQPPLKKAKLQ